MKKIKPARVDVIKALEADDDIGEIVEGLVKRLGRPAVVDELVGALDDPECWRSEETPVFIADALVQLGEIPHVVGALKEAVQLFEEAAAEEGEEGGADYALEDDIVVNACVLALSDGGEAARDAVLKALDDNEMPGARLALIEVLAGLGENGLTDERSWPHIAGLFARDDVDPGLACAFAGAYGDPRAAPLIEALMDKATPSKDGPAAPDNVLIIEACDALDGFDALRDADRQKADEVDWHNDSWEIQKSGEETG